jgi:hypothetical protein
VTRSTNRSWFRPSACRPQLERDLVVVEEHRVQVELVSLPAPACSARSRVLGLSGGARAEIPAGGTKGSVVMMWASRSRRSAVVFVLSGVLFVACSDDDAPKPPHALAGRGGGPGDSGSVSGRAGAPMAGGAPGGRSGEAGVAGGVTEGGEAGQAGGGAGGSPEELPVTPLPAIDESAIPAPRSRAGFIEIAPVTYATNLTGTTDERTSTRSRLFYNLVPAAADAKSKPVFVVFNGGPGVATSLLRSFGTGPRTLDPDALEAASTENPTSLTSLGSLLYIDARQAGYSYALASDASEEDERTAAFNSKSRNEAIDAADFVRVVLRVLALEPSLQNNPVVIVGESYGGVRAPMMLYFLLNPSMLENSQWNYYDPALAAEVSAHLSAVFQKPAAELSQRSIAQQFGWQVLLEPLVVGSYQLQAADTIREDARVELAQELGLTRVELDARCADDVSRTQEWCDGVHTAIDRVSLDPAEFQAFNGLVPSAVAKFAANDRGEAFRLIDARLDPAPDPLGLGALPDWDRYYLPDTGASSTDESFTFTRTPYTGIVFTYTVAYVNTLITNSHYDTNIIPLSIVPALRKLADDFPSLGLQEVGYVGNDPDEPSEAIHLSYSSDSFIPRGGERTIRFPSFPNSGHYVSVSEPERLHAELEDFLGATGL